MDDVKKRKFLTLPGLEYIRLSERTAITSLSSTYNWVYNGDSTPSLRGRSCVLLILFQWPPQATASNHSNVFTFTLLLAEGREGEAWESSNIIILFSSPHNKVSFISPTTFHFHLLFCYILYLSWFRIIQLENNQQIKTSWSLHTTFCKTRCLTDINKYLLWTLRLLCTA
jgi:hypothetical protein